MLTGALATGNAVLVQSRGIGAEIAPDNRPILQDENQPGAATRPQVVPSEGRTRRGGGRSSQGSRPAPRLAAAGWGWRFGCGGPCPSICWRRRGFGRRSPAFGQRSPRLGRRRPAFGRRCPRLGRRSPILGRRCPRLGQRSPRLGRRCPGVVRWRPTAGERRPAGRRAVIFVSGCLSSRWGTHFIARGGKLVGKLTRNSSRCRDCRFLSTCLELAGSSAGRAPRDVCPARIRPLRKKALHVSQFLHFAQGLGPCGR
jgi:hypothetical protein